MVYCRKQIGHSQEVSSVVIHFCLHIHCFIHANKYLTAIPQEVLLDSKYLRMTNLSIRKVLLSPDHNLFAYQTEREGAEVGNLHFKDLTGVKDLKVGFSSIALPQIANCAGSYN